MHPGGLYRVTDEAPLLEWLRRHAFVTLCAAPAGRPLVAHAPVVVGGAGEDLTLDFHLARGNAIAPYLADGFQALAVGLGPDAYVSPDWYESVDQVPTWNYLTVEAEGRVEALDESELVRQLDELSAQEEARLAPKPAWTRHKMSPGRFGGMLRGIIGARMVVERLEGTFKLSQNKTETDRQGVMAALGDHPVAALMRAAIPPP
ncbi:FMN-binding negative transcriptional regulator [Phenylobacterium sp.]|uniref:FMN-binding negative transcriptional regulator n=1 Tax=Phenylobacterium sp. TaxID=1871053 RepID=UPI002BF91488|nr:FMN-binding negative transcriptional regulator [Phenylobacterium sp.]HLZ75170.1 FMN-binding negative transcriptional regulator [Phenylobacterium sp.]